MKKLSILVAVPFDLYFASEIEVQCFNFRKFGYSDKLQVLVYEQGENKYIDYWVKLSERYPEVGFYFYRNDGLKNLTVVYPPVCRPYVLSEHFKKYPELQNDVVLYLDSDVLFTKHMDFSPYMDDDICYCSKTNYITASYFESKRKDVYPFRLQEYDKRDILDECCKLVGIDKQVAIDNEDHTGGCQYLLKNIDHTFWDDLLRSCIELRMHCHNINAEFFPSEEHGFQSWAIGDMCGLLWNLWKRGYKTECPEYLDFNWATTPIEKFYDHGFFHNAGTTSKVQELNGQKHIMFHKSDIRFRTSSLTFFDVVSYDKVSQAYCSCMYVKEFQEIKDPVCVTKLIEY